MENCGEKKDNLTALYKSYCSKTMGRTAACAPSLITIAGFTNLSRKNICMENNVEVVCFTIKIIILDLPYIL